jgi:oligopeptide/dipeptide ABC transporter ATP-binding protein
MPAFVQVDDVSKDFIPRLSIGERIVAGLGGTVEMRTVRAVDRVTLGISIGEVVGLVGESGCGKSTLGRIIAGILPPTSGSARIDNTPVMSGGRAPHKITTRVQMIFQDPFASLDPRMRIGDTVAEGPVAYGVVAKTDAPAYVREWLQRVGLDPEFANRFPHQFSGGQRQRVAIARALAMKPDVLVCDEPLASLDVSIQAQIINLFLKLRRELRLTMLFISHDLGAVRHLSDRVAIMYLGRIVEIGDAKRIYNAPLHPYTRALLDSVPKLVLADAAAVDFRPIQGEPPSPLSPPSGCHFHQRCPIAQARCRSEVPVLKPLSSGRAAACHLVTSNSFH